MSKLDWLDKNDYLHHEVKRQYGAAAWLLWAIALVILLVPVRGSAQNQYDIHAAEDTPTLTGQVVHLAPTHRGRGIRGGKGGRYEAAVDIEYRGKTYRVTNVGFNFTHTMYEQAMETGCVPVYLNPGQPEKSVLSKGVPMLQYFATGLFAALALFLIGTGAYLIRKCFTHNR